jgi:hypothetical protein
LEIRFQQEGSFEMSDDDLKKGKVSRKEFARQLRRQAYQKAKERRAKDPKHIAMKEAAKQLRRDAYRKAKERRKAAVAEQKAREKEKQRTDLAEERATKNEALMKTLRRAAK